MTTAQEPIDTDDQQLITVCASCLRASCWHGEFYCDDYKAAKTIEKSVDDLKKLNLENEHYWLQQIEG